MPFICKLSFLDGFVPWRDMLFSIHHPSMCCLDHEFQVVCSQSSGTNFLLVYLITSLCFRGYTDCCQGRALHKDFLSTTDRNVCLGWRHRCSFRTLGVVIHDSCNTCSHAEACAYPMKKAFRRWQTSGKPASKKRLIPSLLPWIRKH